MKISTRSIQYLLLLFLAVTGASSFAQVNNSSMSSKGTEFWLAFMPNVGEYWQSEQYYTETILYITADEASSVVVRMPALGISFDEDGNQYATDHVLNIPANSSIQVNIPYEFSITNPVGDPSSSDQYVSEVDDDPRGIQVVSQDNALSVYAMNTNKNSADVALVYPAPALGSHHYVMSMGYSDPTKITGGTSAYEMIVVATEDNTEIDITPTGETIGGVPAGQTITVTLDAGEVYQIQSLQDITGSHIYAHDCKPIAVFGGNSITGVPDNAKYKDVLYEQILTTSRYGRRYVGVPFLTRSGEDTYKILALYDDTSIDIFYGGNQKTITLDQGEFSLEFLPINDDEGFYIEATEPIMVAHFSNSGQFDGNSNADPFMDILPSVEQSLKRIVFNVFEGSTIDSYFINIVTETDNIDNITLDGVSIADEFTASTVAGNEKYSFARFPISQGNHILESSGKGFLANIYGYQYRESYGYIAGAMAEQITLDFDIGWGMGSFNHLEFSDTICLYDTLHLEAYEFKNVDVYKWIINDTLEINGMTADYVADYEGEIDIQLIGKRNDECITEADTVFKTITISGQPDILLSLNDSICSGQEALIEFSPADGVFTYDETEYTNFPASDLVLGENIIDYTYTNKYNCTSTITDTVTIFQQNTVDIVASALSVCEGETVELDAGTGDTYMWSTGEDTQIIEVESTNDYSVTVTSEICADSSTVSIEFKPFAIVDLGEDIVHCGDTAFILDAGAADIYSWNTGDDTQTISVDASGEYIVNVDADDCIDADTINIEINPIPVVDLGDDQHVCESVDLDIGFGFETISWNTGDATEMVTVTETDEYIVSVMANGCENSDTINIEVSHNYEIDLGEDITHCGDTAIILDAGEGDAYEWSNGETTQTISVSASADYSVTVENGPCEGVGSISIEVNPIPIVDLGDDVHVCESTVLNVGTGFETISWSTGDDTESLTVTETDEYIVSVINNGCENSDTINVEVSHNYEIDFGEDITHCGDTIIILDAGEGDAYEWSTGETTQTISVSASGDYSVTVENGPCEGTGNITIDIKDIPVIDLGDDLTSCGEIVIDAGVGYDTYEWSTGSAGQNISADEAGEYIVNVSVAGCFNNDTIYADITEPFEVSLGNDISECEGTDVALDAGEGDSFVWNTADETQTLAIDADGTYAVTVTKGHCEATDEIDVLFIPNVTPEVTITVSESDICEGTEIVFSIEAEDNLGDTPLYQWKVNGEDVSTDVSFTTADLTEDSEITLIVISSEVCVTSETTSHAIEVVVTPNVTPAFELQTSALSVCEGENIDFSIIDIENEGDTPEYEWILNDEPIDADLSFASTDLTDGDVISVTMVSSERCVTENNINKEAAVEIFTYPEFTLGNDSLLCSNEVIVLSADNDVDIVWSDGNTDQDRIVRAPGGEFIATADNNGCEVSDTVLVEFTSLPNFEIIGEDVIYRGDTAYYEVSVEFASYLWNNSEMKRNISIQPEETQTYWVAVEDVYECRDTSYKTLEVLPRPEINIQVDPFCEGESRELTVQDDFDVYEWNTGETTKSITVTTAGEYIVKASRTDEPGITLLDTVIVSVIENPDFELTGDSEVCEGEFAQIETDYESLYRYNWSIGETTESIKVIKSGTYTLSVTAFGCTSVESFDVLVHLAPDKPQITPEINLCFDDDLPSLWAIGENISWYTDEQLTLPVNEGEVFDLPVYLPNGIAVGNSETYYLQSNNETCVSEVASVEINRKSMKTELSIGGDTDFCVGDELQPLTVNGLLRNFNWEFEGADFQHSDDEIVYFNFAEEGEFIFSVYTEDDNNCKYSANQTVTVHPLPDVDFEFENFEGEVTFTNVSDNPSTTDYYWKLPPEYEWEYVENDVLELSFGYGSHETYLKAISDEGCVDSVYKGVFVEQPMTLFVPNAIHPDHEFEKVQIFLPVGMNIEYYEIWIYDNFSNTVFYSNQLDENGAPAESWDGKYKGNILRSDVYKWKIKARFANGEYWTNGQDMTNVEAREGVWGNIIILR